MPQSAITPIAAATPPPAVANAHAQVSARTAGETSGDATPAQTGGFADALKRQLNGGGQAKDKEKDTGAQAKAPEDASPATVPLIPFAPPDLASLLPGLNLKPQAPFLAQGSGGGGGQTDATAAAALSGGNGIVPGAKGKEPLASMADLRAEPGQPGSFATADFAGAGKAVQDKLAPLTGSLAGNDEKASAGQPSSDNFQAALAASSEVRDALEQSLPRLREMFANAGISLGQANVSGESSAGQQSGREERGRRYGGVDALAASTAAAPAQLLRGGNRMEDTLV